MLMIKRARHVKGARWPMLGCVQNILEASICINRFYIDIGLNSYHFKINTQLKRAQAESMCVLHHANKQVKDFALLYQLNRTELAWRVRYALRI